MLLQLLHELWLPLLAFALLAHLLRDILLPLWLLLARWHRRSTVWPLEKKAFVLFRLTPFAALVPAILFYSSADEYASNLLSAQLKHSGLTGNGSGYHEPLEVRYLLNRYPEERQHIVLAYQSCPLEALRVYGWFGDLPMLHAVVSENGKEALRIINHAYDEPENCLLRPHARRQFLPLQRYLRSASESQAITSATCALFKLYDEGACSAGKLSVVDGVLVRNGGNNCGTRPPSYDKEKRPLFNGPIPFAQVVAIGRPAREMATLRTITTERPLTDITKSFVEWWPSKFIDRLLKFVRWTKVAAPGFFEDRKATKMLTSALVLTAYNPATPSSAIAIWSGTTGIVLFYLQWAWWTFACALALPLLLGLFGLLSVSFCAFVCILDIVSIPPLAIVHIVEKVKTRRLRY